MRIKRKVSIVCQGSNPGWMVNAADTTEAIAPLCINWGEGLVG